MNLKECSIALRHLAMLVSKRVQPTHKVAIAARPETLLLLQHTQAKLHEIAGRAAPVGPTAQIIRSLSVLRHLTHPCAAEAAAQLASIPGDIELPVKTLMPLAQNLAAFVATAHRTETIVDENILQLLVRLQQPLCRALENDTEGTTLRYAPALLVRWLSLVQATHGEGTAQLLVPDADTVVHACLESVSSGIAHHRCGLDELRPALDNLQSLRVSNLTPTEKQAWTTIMGLFSRTMTSMTGHLSPTYVATLAHRASQMAALAQAAGPAAAVSAAEVQKHITDLVVLSSLGCVERSPTGLPRVPPLTQRQLSEVVGLIAARVQSDPLGLGHPTLDTSGCMAAVAQALARIPLHTDTLNMQRSEGLACIAQAWGSEAEQMAAWRNLAIEYQGSVKYHRDGPLESLQCARGLVQLASAAAADPRGQAWGDAQGARNALSITTVLLLRASKGVGKAVRLSSLPLCSDLATAGLMLHETADVLSGGQEAHLTTTHCASSVGATVGMFGLSAARASLRRNALGHALSTPGESIVRLCILQAAGGVTGEAAWMPLLQTLIMRSPLLPDAALIRALAAPALAALNSQQVRLMAQGGRKNLRAAQNDEPHRGLASGAHDNLFQSAKLPLIEDWASLWRAWPELPPPPADHARDVSLLHIMPRGVPLSSGGGLMAREGGLPRPSAAAVEAAKLVLEAATASLQAPGALQPMLGDALEYTQERLRAAQQAVGKRAYAAEAPAVAPGKWFVPPQRLAKSFAQHELALLQAEVDAPHDFGGAAAGGDAQEITHHRALAGMATRLALQGVADGRFQLEDQHVELRVDALRKLAVFGGV